MRRGKLAALSAVEYIAGRSGIVPDCDAINSKLAAVNRFLRSEPSLYQVEDIEDAMQKTMDDYAGGISSGYRFNLQKLQVAKQKLAGLLELSTRLTVQDLHQLMLVHEVIDRLQVCAVLIRHLEAERDALAFFPGNADYPEKTIPPG